MVVSVWTAPFEKKPVDSIRSRRTVRTDKIRRRYVDTRMGWQRKPPPNTNEFFTVGTVGFDPKGLPWGAFGRILDQPERSQIIRGRLDTGLDFRVTKTFSCVWLSMPSMKVWSQKV